MEKPTVQVIRFQARDVIATSGGQPLVSNTNYLATASEAKQAGIYDYGIDCPWVYFYGDLSYSTNVEGVGEFDSYKGQNSQYAWYANNQWWTNGKTIAELGYGYNTNLPTENPND